MDLRWLWDWAQAGESLVSTQALGKARVSHTGHFWPGLLGLLEAPAKHSFSSDPASSHPHPYFLDCKNPEAWFLLPFPLICVAKRSSPSASAGSHGSIETRGPCKTPHCLVTVREDITLHFQILLEQTPLRIP